MIDTLHLEVPRGSGYTIAYRRSMANLSAETQKKAIRQGRDYSQVLDLRYIDIPALLHVANNYDSKLGDKFEFLGAGSLKTSEMVGYLREVYETDAEECGVMRVDLTGDIDGQWVPWCRVHLRAMNKQRTQMHIPTYVSGEISMHRAETINWGTANNQMLVYDKTAERLHRLHKKLRKLSREGRNELTLEQHFEREYGYSMDLQITRFERRMGSRESGKVFDISKFGQINKTAYINPFNRIEFPPEEENSRIPKCFNPIEIEYIRAFVQRHGLINARNEMFRTWGEKAFYRYFKGIRPLLFGPERKQGPTMEQIRKSYQESTLQQLA